MGMLLKRVRFTFDGLECDKIGLSYEAFNGQPNFYSSPFWSCLHDQLWNFHEVREIKLNIYIFPLIFNFLSSPCIYHYEQYSTNSWKFGMISFMCITLMEANITFRNWGNISKMPIIREEAVIQSTSICVLRGTLIIFIIHAILRKTLHKHRHKNKMGIMQHVDDNIRHRKRR